MCKNKIYFVRMITHYIIHNVKINFILDEKKLLFKLIIQNK